MDNKEKVENLCAIYGEFDDEGRDKMVGIVERVLILQKEIKEDRSYLNEKDVKVREYRV